MFGSLLLYTAHSMADLGLFSGCGRAAVAHDAPSCSPRCLPGIYSSRSKFTRRYQLGQAASRHVRQHAPRLVVAGSAQAPASPGTDSGLASQGANDSSGQAGLSPAEAKALTGEPAVPPAATQSLFVAPEDYVLPPGQLSTINHSAPTAPDDVFRCPGCTEAACQVRGQNAARRVHVERGRRCAPLPRAGLHTRSCLLGGSMLSGHEQSPSCTHSSRGLQTLLHAMLRITPGAGPQRLCRHAVAVRAGRLPAGDPDGQGLRRGGERKGWCCGWAVGEGSEVDRGRWAREERGGCGRKAVGGSRG